MQLFPHLSPYCATMNYSAAKEGSFEQTNERIDLTKLPVRHYDSNMKISSSAFLSASLNHYPKQQQQQDLLNPSTVLSENIRTKIPIENNSNSSSNCISNNNCNNCDLKRRASSSFDASMIIKSMNICKKDVLCGRDKLSFSHVGNKRFRVIIDMHRDRYQGMSLKEEKTRIIMDIIKLIEESGGRFLKRVEVAEDDGASSKAESLDFWCLANQQCSREKVSHALRSHKHRKRKAVPRKSKEIIIPKPSVQEELRFQEVLNLQQSLFSRLMDPNNSVIKNGNINENIFAKQGGGRRFC